MDELLRLDGLRRDYGRLCAFRSEQLALPPGIVGLLGPNGAGKSTLLRMLMGLLRPTTGSARVLGLDIVEQGLAVRSRVGYMPENDSFVAGLSVLRFVTLAGELAGMPRTRAFRRAHEVLDFLGVEESRYRPIEEHSTGMKQRAKLAQAMVHDPDLLILDEPTNGLDPGGRVAMLELIRSLRRDHGKSVLVSSHLLADIERIGDSVIILDRGTVLAHGRIADLRGIAEPRWRVKIEGAPDVFVDRLRERGAEVVWEGDVHSAITTAVVEWPGGDGVDAILDAWIGLGDEPGCVLRGISRWEEDLSGVFERVVGARARGAAPRWAETVGTEDLVDG